MELSLSISTTTFSERNIQEWSDCFDQAYDGLAELERRLQKVAGPIQHEYIKFLHTLRGLTGGTPSIIAPTDAQ